MTISAETIAHRPTPGLPDIPPPAQQRAAGYRRDIDGLRAVAVLSVVLFHAFPDLLSGGFVGVDIFFVISGFLISGHIFSALDDRSFQFLDFYARRIKRIYPALILVLLAVLVTGLSVMFASELTVLGKDVAASSAFCSNVLFYLSQGYFEPAAMNRVLLHLWSLGVEEQYYIIWPIILVFCWKRMAKSVLLTLIVCATSASFIASIILTPLHGALSFYLPITRFWELMLGSLLAWMELYHNSAGLVGSAAGLIGHEKRSNLVAVLGAILLAISTGLLTDAEPFPGWRAALPTIGAVLLLAAGPSAWLNRHVLASRPAVYVGLISYPLYLWHWPILAYARLLDGGSPSEGMIAIALALSFALAIATFHVVERPLRFSAFAYRRHYALAGLLLAAMAIVGFAGLAISWASGLPRRFPSAAFQLGEQQHWVKDAACDPSLLAGDFCIVNRTNKPVGVMLLGDSHAAHLMPGLIATSDMQRFNLLAMGSGNCPPFPTVDLFIAGRIKPCSKIFTRALHFAAVRPKLEVVILSSYAVAAAKGGLDYDERGLLQLHDAATGRGGDNLALYLHGLAATLERLQRAGKSVVMVLDTPELDFDPTACADRPLQTDHHASCTVARTKVIARQATTRAGIATVLRQFPKVRVVDPISLLCDASVCHAKIGGTVLYADRDHLSHAGSRFLAPAIVRAIDLDIHGSEPMRSRSTPLNPSRKVGPA